MRKKRTRKPVGQQCVSHIFFSSTQEVFNAFKIVEGKKKLPRWNSILSRLRSLSHLRWFVLVASGNFSIFRNRFRIFQVSWVFSCNRIYLNSWISRHFKKKKRVKSLLIRKLFMRFITRRLNISWLLAESWKKSGVSDEIFWYLLTMQMRIWDSSSIPFCEWSMKVFWEDKWYFATYYYEVMFVGYVMCVEQENKLEIFFCKDQHWSEWRKQNR